MADATADLDEQEKKPSKLPLILAALIGLSAGAGGFFVTYSGKLFSNEEMSSETKENKVASAADGISFIPIDPLVVSIGNPMDGKHLKFRAQIEVPNAYSEEVTKLMPRIVDILNGYLRAIEPADLEAPAALVRLRSQMLRRVTVVVGTEKVNDLLVMEFVVN